MSDDTQTDAPTDSVEASLRRAKLAFEQGVMLRDEAAKPDSTGKLPTGATHEITGADAEGKPILKRQRFSTV